MTGDSVTGQSDVFQQAMNQGHSAAWDQNWEKAAIYYRQALDESPENPQALINLGLALIELQEYEEALLCYQNAAKLLPEDPLPLEKIAQLCERLGNLELAAQASLKCADLYLGKKDVQKAIENWERVTRLDPENLPAHSKLAVVYEKMGEKSKAVSEYLTSASTLQSIGNPEKARQAIEKALKILPESPEALYYLNLLKDYKSLPRPIRPRGGTAPLRMSQVRQLQYPQSAAQMDMDPVTQACQKALTVLAGMLFESEEDGEEPAQRKGLQAIVSGVTGRLSRPNDRTRMLVHLSQVVDLQTRGEYARAADELQRGIDMGLQHPAAYFDLGYLHSQTGRLESAIRYLQTAVNSTDFALGARLMLGDLFRKKNQLREASFEYLQALKLADVQIAPGDQAEGLSQLYELMIEEQHQHEDAELEEMLCKNIKDMLYRPNWHSQIQRARRQMPGSKEKGSLIPLAGVLTEARSSHVIESISRIYEMVENGWLDSALEEAYFALQQAPTYLPIHALIGEMLMKQGNNGVAAEKYRVISRTYASRNEMDQAIQSSKNVVQLMPTDLEARNRLIAQLLASGQVGSAIDEYMQLAEIYYNMADIGMARRTYMEAFKSAQLANEERSIKVRLLQRIADIDLQRLEWRQGLRILEQIRTLQPDNEEARAQIVSLNLRLGQEPQAMTEIDNYAAFLASSNRYRKLAAFTKNLLMDYPDSVPLRRRLVDAYIHVGEIDEAISNLDHIGESLLESGDRAGAIQTIEEIIELSPPNKENYRQLLDQVRRELG
jgi:tetratricopeptide (TPR) repeat protein